MTHSFCFEFLASSIDLPKMVDEKVLYKNLFSVFLELTQQNLDLGMDFLAKKTGAKSWDVDKSLHSML